MAARSHASKALVPAALSLPSRAAALWPGLALTSAIAAAAFGLRQLPYMGGLSPMILAIVIGMMMRNTFGTPARSHAGVVFAMRRILRFAIVLLGLQLTAAQVVEVGGTGLAVIALTLVATFVFTTWLGRLIGVERGLAELIAAGTSICGASAVIATNTVTRAPDEDVAYAVACVTVFGSIAMLVYPLLVGVLALSPHAYGLWAGASIHEIAQVVAAAYQDGAAAGEFGTIAKLSRVMLLAPVVLALGLIAARRTSWEGGEASGARPPMPWFVLGFLALVAFNSAVALPADLKSSMVTLTAFLLSMALAAMGLETSFVKLKAKGVRPLALGFAAFAFIAGFSLMLVKLTA
ncbi:YeiH family protein [Ancylobacter defluvii]|uniref:Membrane protein n=1 Tax=Ancylobacter defluvii TaxID=1282440 RepID=A0A9W6JW06_9HYPH|nr:YeiH family protein [Ancylobacter defluvii]MBS7590418.1 YeiH family putative sulfate export transporter [Ancylobacter defluvii]GLK83339.1 membrane protein [Ancylobacter defluvii]